MTPLNLALEPPRPPHDALDGLFFLPRSIDKVRAKLPGGNSEPCVIAGPTQMMLDRLDVRLDAFTLVVRGADDERDSAAVLRGGTTPATYDEWNAEISSHQQHVAGTP